MSNKADSQENPYGFLKGKSQMYPTLESLGASVLLLTMIRTTPVILTLGVCKEFSYDIHSTGEHIEFIIKIQKSLKNAFSLFLMRIMMVVLAFSPKILVKED